MDEKNHTQTDSTGKKVGRSFFSMFKRLIIREKIEKNILEEEALRTPMKTVLLKLVRNKMAIVGFCVFVAVLLFCFVGSMMFPLDEGYTELTNMNLRPSRNFLRYPQELEDMNIVKIVSGVSFSVALTDDGNLHIWGTECNRELEGVSDYILGIPEEVQDAFIVDVAAGSRFIVTLDDEGEFRGWGHALHNQTEISEELQFIMMLDRSTDIIQIVAGSMWSAVLADNGRMYLWGSLQATSNLFVPLEAQGRIKSVAAGDVNLILLLDDGTIFPMGTRGTEFFEDVPPELMDGSIYVEEVAVTNRNVLARDSDGKVYLWGSPIDGLLQMPDEVRGETAVYITAGYNNFIVVDDDGDVFIWGAHQLGQDNIPGSIRNAHITRVFAGMFQFYAMDGDDNLVGAWGNRGYIFGSDHFGRDLFTRLMHGGRTTLTVGIIAVILATFIAITVGLTSGFFGGWVDHTLMRVADIFDALPFLPLVVTLSYAISDNLNQQQRLYFIMVLLGFLSWTGLARLIRAQLLLEREKDFVLAARALGIKQRNIMVKHILPNVFNFVIVSVTLSYASFLLIEAVLSFLGFGVREPTPSWGNMLSGAENSTVMQYFWWRWVIPGAFVITAALSINMIGDALREAMDPKSNER